jgi:hypothetical protein
MKIYLLVVILFVFVDCVHAADIFSIKILQEQKLANDSLFFQLIDQQRVVKNDGIVKLDIFHVPSGHKEQKMTWLQAGTCNQFITSKGLSNGKLFIRATTTVGGIENTRSEFLIFVQDAKILSVQHLYDTSLANLAIEPESGALLAGFSNKIAINILDNKTGKQEKDRVRIFTDRGDTLSRFTVAGKRLIDIYLEEGKKYFLQTSKSKPLELTTSNYGYSIQCKQIGDSIDIEIFRAKQQPIEKLFFCLQVNNKLDTIADFMFDDTLFVMNARFYWPTVTSNQYIGFVLLNSSNITLVKRYWVADNELLKQSPFFTKLDTNKIAIDSSFTLRFLCKSCDKEKITYQVTNSSNELFGVGQVNWISDSVFTINNLQLVGKGYLELQVNRDNMNWKPIFQTIAIPIEKPQAIFYAKEDAIQAIVDNNSTLNNTYVPNNANVLPEVSVTGIKKTRMEELENKYVHNIMFKSMFSININVLDDENSKNVLTILKYVQLQIPITRVKRMPSKIDRNSDGLIYRNAEVEYWIDEIYYDAESGRSILSSMYPSDVAYIKLLKNPIRGLTSNGSLGALLIYTKKGNEKELDKRFNQRVTIEGIQILE